MPPEAVDDIVSETFLVVWRRLDDVPEPALPWLLIVARNVVGTEAAAVLGEPPVRFRSACSRPSSIARPHPGVARTGVAWRCAWRCSPARSRRPR